MKRTITILTTTMLSLLFVVLSQAGELPRGITLKEAIAIAAEKAPGEVIKAELEDGIYEIKIKGAGGETEKVHLDAATGKEVKKVPVSLGEATAIALKEVAGEVVKVEFERGRYEIKIRGTDGALKEVYVNGISGNIVKIKNKKKVLK